MQSLLKRLALLIITLLLIPAAAFAMPEIMPLDQVKSGMSGVAYTVVDNSGVIEPFNVDIIELMDNGKESDKLIMAKASGSVIDRTKGILQGMSGSPIYVDGKLVGALAIGLKDMSSYTFFITPIERMLPLWDMPDPKAINKYHQAALKAQEEEAKNKEAEPKDDKSKDDKSKDDKSKNDKSKDKKSKDKASKDKKTEDKASKDKKSDDKKAKDKKSEDKASKDDKSKDKKSKDKDKPAKAEKVKPDEDKSNVEADLTKSKVEEKGSLFFNGFSSSGAEFLKREFAPLGMKNFYAAGVTNSKNQIDYNASLEPGSSFGVAIVYGDFSVGATGTVTAVDGKKVLGFGHSFTHTGNVNYFMTNAAVVGSISGAAEGTGVRIANLGNIIGRINQDREAGIAGVIGQFPSVVPIKVNINDKSLNKSDTYNAVIAYNENFIPKLGASIAYAALNKTSDTLDGSTVTVDFGIKTNAVKSGKLERQNMFYNTTDVGQVAVIELMQALNLICSNTTEESDIFGIDVDITVNSDRNTASLISAVPDKAKVKPGDTVNLTVTLQPYRKQSETVVVPYTIPVTAKEGPLTLDVHGGALVSIAQALANAGLIVVDSDSTKSNEERIKDFLNTGKNNQIVVELGAAAEPKNDRELKKEIERAKRAQEKAAKAGKKTVKTTETKVDTNYIIDNVIHAVVDVDKL